MLDAAKTACFKISAYWDHERRAACNLNENQEIKTVVSKCSLICVRIYSQKMRLNL